MSVERVTYQARGLRTGEIGTLRLVRSRGPVSFVVDGEELARDALDLAGARESVDAHSATGAAGAAAVRRHRSGLDRVLAALAGLSVHSGVEVELEGPELPLLDGSGLEIALALRALGAPRDRPRLRVAQSGEVLAGRARFSFEPRPTIEVAVDTEAPGGARQRAQWDGTPAAFLGRIAARPLQIGGADSVRILARETSTPTRGEPSSPVASRPRDTDEGRGALLGLLADLYRFGGPPLGRVFVRHPDPATSEAALQQALSFGLLERMPPT